MLNLVPYPKKVKETTGTCNLSGNAVIGADLKGSVPVTHKLSELGLKSDFSGTGFTFVIGDCNLPEAPDKPEGYSLTVTEKGVAAAGADEDGLFWGLTTLQQLLDGGKETACCEITDWPEFPFRGHHDDISRKQVSTVEDFKRIIRHLSNFKINYYTPYIEDMIHLRSFPEIGEGRGKLMPEEVQAICEEGKKYNIDVFPSYSLIGHQENMLSDFRFEHLGKSVFQSMSSYDPENMAVRKFLEVAIREVCELFPDAGFFNACFDETQGIEEEVLIDHANWCAGQLEKHGKKMLMWVDMFKNHYGLDKIKKLSGNITPIEWQYGDPTVVEKEYVKEGVVPLGYAGYSNWCRFLPDTRQGKENIDLWCGMMTRMGGKGWIASMWGDNGYENSRDLSWNLFAYSGERGWCGEEKASGFNTRFSSVFYGAPMKELVSEIVRLPEKRKITSGASWGQFRETMQQLVRRVTDDPSVGDGYRKDLPIINKALDTLESVKEEAVREKEHLNHYACALMRERNIARRVVLASDIAAGLSEGDLEKRVQEEIADLEKTRDFYRTSWLQNNKEPNIEVSIGVYNTVGESLRALLRAEVPRDPGYIEADMSRLANSFFAPTAGLPLGRDRIHGVPFTFAPEDKTHCRIEPGQNVSFPFTASYIKDIHLVYGGQTLKTKDFSDLLNVELRLKGETVFRERLRNIKDIVCWWAPLGEHMWAGGGYRHANQERNHWALRPGAMYGLMRFSGFALGDGIEADEVVLQAVGNEEFALYAMTLEKTVETSYRPYSQTALEEVRLEYMSPAQADNAKKKRPAVYVPFGSVEWHGRQNAVGLDTVKVHEILCGLASRAGGVVYPSVFFGSGGGHGAYPHSFMLSPEPLKQIVAELLEGFQRDGYEKAVLVSGHYPNKGEYLNDARNAYKGNGGTMDVLVVQENQLPGVEGDHAAKNETSFQMFLNPDTVDLHALDRDSSLTYAPDEKYNWMDEPESHPNWGILGVDPWQYASRKTGKLYSEAVIDGLLKWLEGEYTTEQIENWELKDKSNQ